jgi:hypothetical protein
MITTAAASGWSMPSEAPIAEAYGSARLLPERPEGVEEVGDAAAGLSVAGLHGDSDGCGDEPECNQQRPERDDARGRARDDERAEHDRPGGAERRKGAAGRPEPGLVREHAREEPDPHDVACAGRHEGVDERAGTVPGAGVADRDAPAAEADRAAPGPGGCSDRDGEADAGEPEPLRVGGSDGVQRCRDPGTEELRRRDGGEEDEEEQDGRGDPATSHPGVDLLEHGLHTWPDPLLDVQR